MNIQILLIGISLLGLSCQNSPGINEDEFFSLMRNIERGWSTQNTELALSSFDKDAIYMQPPDKQYYRGHNQLRPYFDELTPKHRMKFHHLWFDSQLQKGAGEFTFSYGTEVADSGVVIVELVNGKVKFWREYIMKGPSEFDEFIRIDRKQWEWHIGNYPEPKDSLAN